MLRSQREKGRSKCGWFSQDRQLFNNDVRDVGALSDDFLDERRGLPGRAHGTSCFVKGRSRRDEGRSKCGWYAQDRRVLNFLLVLAYMGV